MIIKILINRSYLTKEISVAILEKAGKKEVSPSKTADKIVFVLIMILIGAIVGGWLFGDNPVIGGLVGLGGAIWALLTDW